MCVRLNKVKISFAVLIWIDCLLKSKFHELFRDRDQRLDQKMTVINPGDHLRHKTCILSNDPGFYRLALFLNM